MKKFKNTILLLVGILLLALSACKVDDVKANLELNKILIELNVNATFKLELSENGIIVMDDITWTSADSKIATVNNGEVKGISEGNTKITAEYNSNSVDCNVKVIARDSFNLSETNVILEIGNELTLKLLNNGNEVTDGITWKTNEASIISVTNGTIKGLAKGDATVTAIHNNKSYICNVTIMEKFNPVGAFVAERVVEEMGGVKFTFDLKLNSDNTYEYSRRTVKFEGDTFEGGSISKGIYSYSHGLLILTNDNTRIQFKVKDQDTLQSVGKIDTGRVESELTFVRVK